MTKEKKRKRIIRKLIHKFRLVIFNEETFEEKFSIRLNRLNVFVITGLTVLFLIIVTTFVIAFTPLREYIPGYASTSLNQKAISVAFKADSLERVLEANNQYLASIQRVLVGEVHFQQINKDSIFNAVELEFESMSLAPSAQDSLLREMVDREERFNIAQPSTTLSTRPLFPPVKGIISSSFNVSIKHYAVDIVVPQNTPVRAVADGTVIFSEWSAQTGNVIIIKHANNLVSVYKHNASLIKQQGDLVRAGEVIATAGSTGALTTGTHLHFELWSNGYPVNPTLFIDFE